MPLYMVKRDGTDYVLHHKDLGYHVEFNEYRSRWTGHDVEWTTAVPATIVQNRTPHAPERRLEQDRVQLRPFGVDIATMHEVHGLMLGWIEHDLREDW